MPDADASQRYENTDSRIVWTHSQVRLCSPPACHSLTTAGSSVLLQDDRIMIAYSAGPCNVHDAQAGETRIYVRESASGEPTADGWGPERLAIHHPECQAAGGKMLRAHDGTIWIFYLGYHRKVWVDGEPDVERNRSDVWCARSVDEGQTWTDRRMIFQGYCGAIITAIQMANGTIVVPISYVVTNPGRLVSGSVVSSDNGQCWQQSTSVDIGQRGDHSGAVEPTVVELRDGRLWMVIRTNLGRFYQAFSEDRGLTWSAPTPTELQSPSAPGYLLRLRSGNLAFIWNNTMHRAEGIEKGATGRVDGVDLNMSLRDTLSMAFSADDGKSWTKPVELARAAQLSYPFVLEISPGLLLCHCHLVQAGWNDLKPVLFCVEEQTLIQEGNTEGGAGDQV